MNNEYETKKNGYEFSFDNNNWIVGLALIVVGGLFLMDSFGILDVNLTNWWAVFILIPGLNMAISGWRRYQETQSDSSRKSGMIGMFLIVIACTFFFNISWHLIFPVILIGGGIYLLLSR